MLSQQAQPKQQLQKKVSFSELKIWNECAFKHKLTYIDQLKSFNGNEYTAFGTAVHYVCETLVFNEKIDTASIFQKRFVEEIKSLDDINSLNKKLLLEMKDQGRELFDEVLPSLKEQFPGYEVIAVEEPIFEEITEFETEKNFKGFIDLVLKTPDGKYHVIDWKTCSWGWNTKRKNEKMTVYQLSFYKNYFGKKYNIDEGKIETYFALLKRTSKKSKVEIFRVSNGKKRIGNAILFLKQALMHIKSKNYVKNRLSCNRCEFYKTPHCP